MGVGRTSGTTDRNNMISSARETVSGAISNAVRSHAGESIQDAIRSFEWATPHLSFIEPSGTHSQHSIQNPGFVDSPTEFFGRCVASKSSTPASKTIVSMQDVLKNLRTHGFQFQRGVDLFLKCGIREALASMKGKTASQPATVIRLPLDELLSPEKLKTANPAELHASLETMNRMFSTLTGAQKTSLDIKANMMQFIRC